MAEYLFLVLTNPVEGKDVEFNQWYSEHLQSVLGVEGFEAARRYRMVAGENLPQADNQYMTLYEVVTADLGQTFSDLKTMESTGPVGVSPALDRSTTVAGFYELIDEVVADG